jgi:hypothetical protein
VRKYNVLNLGAGVQSTAMYLLAREGKLRFEVSIFADTGDVPAAVYRHLDWLCSLGDPPIWVRSRGRLGDDLLGGVNATGQRFASIPAFIGEDHTTRPRFCAPASRRAWCGVNAHASIRSRWSRRPCATNSSA